MNQLGKSCVPIRGCWHVNERGHEKQNNSLPKAIHDDVCATIQGLQNFLKGKKQSETKYGQLVNDWEYCLEKLHDVRDHVRGMNFDVLSLSEIKRSTTRLKKRKKKKREQ